jgi:phosphopantothenoylcysteine decarboxylase/phosphopantothenate--cysteine ligase
MKKFDIIINCAAISDYIPIKHKGKISSGKGNQSIELKPSPKIIQTLRQKAPKAKIIGFKAEEKKQTIKQKSIDLLRKNKLDYVVANTLEGFNKDESEIWIYTKKDKIFYKKDKKETITDYILDIII